MKKVILIFTMILLVGCGNNTKMTYAVCEDEALEGIKSVIELSAADDIVQSYRVLVGFSKENFEGLSDQEIEEAFKKDMPELTATSKHIEFGVEQDSEYIYQYLSFLNLKEITSADYAEVGYNGGLMFGDKLSDVLKTFESDSIVCISQ